MVLFSDPENSSWMQQPSCWVICSKSLTRHSGALWKEFPWVKLLRIAPKPMFSAPRRVLGFEGTLKKGLDQLPLTRTGRPGPSQDFGWTKELPQKHEINMDRVQLVCLTPFRTTARKGFLWYGFCKHKQVEESALMMRPLAKWSSAPPSCWVLALRITKKVQHRLWARGPLACREINVTFFRFSLTSAATRLEILASRRLGGIFTSFTEEYRDMWQEFGLSTKIGAGNPKTPLPELQETLVLRDLTRKPIPFAVSRAYPRIQTRVLTVGG